MQSSSRHISSGVQCHITRRLLLIQSFCLKSLFIKSLCMAVHVNLYQLQLQQTHANSMKHAPQMNADVSSN